MGRQYSKGKKFESKKKGYDSRSKGKERNVVKSLEKEDFNKKAGDLDKNPGSTYNKVEYYIRDKAILDQASQLSFQNFAGATPIDNYEVPTIMKIYMNPSPGITYLNAIPAIMHPAKSGINLAATKLFVKLSMHSGRNMVYAPQDVATLILALSQIFAMHSFVRRLFGTVNISNVYNRMFPRAAIQAMGIDYDDFVDNYADYRTRYNALVATVNKVPILFNCGYLQKSATQYDFLFTDQESPLAQIYMYLPYSTWIIDEQSYSGGTILKTLPVCPLSGTVTFASLMATVFRPMVSALLTSSTLNLVYADLLRLAQNDSTVKFTTIDPIIDGFGITPVHSYEALLHIHNSTSTLPPTFPTLGTNTTPNNDVYPYPSENALIYNPGFVKSGITTNLVNEEVVVDSPTPNPDAGTRLEMFRYVSQFTNNGETSGGVAYLNYCILPDYYIVAYRIVSFDPATTLGVSSWWPGATTCTPTEAAKLSQFDWHPIVRNFDPATGNYTDLIGDLNFYTTVPVQYLERLNEVTYLGLFDMDNN